MWQHIESLGTNGNLDQKTHNFAKIQILPKLMVKKKKFETPHKNFTHNRKFRKFLNFGKKNVLVKIKILDTNRNLYQKIRIFAKNMIFGQKQNLAQNFFSTTLIKNIFKTLHYQFSLIFALIGPPRLWRMI